MPYKNRLRKRRHSTTITGTTTGTSDGNTTGPPPPVEPTASSSSSSLSSARSGDGGMSNDDLTTLFECPVCFDYALPPIIFQCSNGHLVCASCHPKLIYCPTCRVKLENIRNLAMEKVAVYVKFPCKYSTHGCTASLIHTEKTEHEENCNYCLSRCPYPFAVCNWQGPLIGVANHLMSFHQIIHCFPGPESKVTFQVEYINQPGALQWVVLREWFGRMFMLVLEKINHCQFFYASVQLIGTRREADNFVYRWEWNSNECNLSWECKTGCISEGLQLDGCFILSVSNALQFINNGDLCFNVTVLHQR